MADIFLELVSSGGSLIKGESTDQQFPWHIELKSFSMRGPSFSRKKKKKAAKKAAKGEDSEEAKPAKTFTFSISKDVDKATPVLVQTYSKNLGDNSEPYSKAVVRFRLPHTDAFFVFLVMTFTDVHLTKYDVDLDDETSIPTEKIDFAFKAIEIQYLPQDASGNAGKSRMTATWSANTAPTT